MAEHPQRQLHRIRRDLLKLVSSLRRRAAHHLRDTEMDLDLSALEALGPRIDDVATLVAKLQTPTGITPEQEQAAIDAQKLIDQGIDITDAAAAYTKGQTDQLTADQAAVGNLAGVLGDKLTVVEEALAGNTTGNVTGNTTAPGNTTQPAVLTISPDALPAGTVGVAYSEQLKADGAVGTPEFSSGGLPPGLGLTTAGLLSGIPAAAGDTSFSVAVNDTAGNAGEATYDLSVIAAAPGNTTGDGNTTDGNATLPLALSGDPSLPLTPGVVGEAYAATVAAEGGVPPYVFSFADLPDGLVGDDGGNITGTPTTAGDNDVEITVIDSADGEVTETAPLDVTAAAQ